MSVEQPWGIIELASTYDLSKYQVLFFVVALFVVLGCFFGAIELMVMTLPFIFPLLVGFGFDPVWLGVFITIMIEIGMITPPVGVNLYVLLAVTRGEVELGDIAKQTVPYWILLLVGTFIITVFPQVALFLPNLIM